MKKAKFKPVIVFMISARLIVEQRTSLSERLASSFDGSGWLPILMDGFDKADVKAFGIPESKLEEFEALKASMLEFIDREKAKKDE